MGDQSTIFAVGTTSLPSVKAKYTWIIQNIDDFVKEYPHQMQSSPIILEHKGSGRSSIWYLKYANDKNAGFNIFWESRNGESYFTVTIIYKISVGDPAGPMNYSGNGSALVEFAGFYKNSIIILPMKVEELMKCREDSDSYGNGFVRVCIDLEVKGPVHNVVETDLWPKFHPDPLTNNTAKFYNDSTFADVTVRCDEKTFPAHKIILGQNSVFSSMLKSPMKEGLTSEIVISDVDPSVLELFLKSLYGLPIEVPSEPDQVIQLLDSAEKYDLLALKWTCLTQMRDSLSDSTAAEFTIAVFKYSENDDVRKYFRSYCQRRMKLLVNDEKFKQLYKDCLEAFV